MSRTASIEISYNEHIDIVDFIDKLISSEWNYNDYEKIRYMIDKEFEWQTASLETFSKVMEIIKSEYLKRKIVAINFLYKDKTGAAFIFINENSIALNLNINRKMIKNGINTDFSFYIEALNNIITNDCYIRCFETP